MYIPPAFRVEDANKLAAFIQRHSFSTLITYDGSAPFASHLPMLYRPDVGSHGTLVAHMARANPVHGELVIVAFGMGFWLYSISESGKLTGGYNVCHM